MKTVVISLLLAAVLPSPAHAARHTSAHAARYKSFDCLFLNGPEYRWTVPVPGGKRIKSSAYFLSGFGTTCSYAKTWVRRLAKEPYRGARKTIKHGPAGWRCRSAVNSPALHVATAYKGDCQNRKDVRRVFSWGPQSGHDEPVDPPVVSDPPPAPEPVDPPAYP